MKEIFDKHFRRIVLFCNSLLKNMADAEDVAVETFIELYKHHDESRTEDQIKAYLILVSKNKCLNLIKRKKIVTCELSNDVIDCAEINAIVIEKLYQQMSKEIEHLPWRQREVAKLLIFGLSTKQIADKLGMSYKTVFNTKYKLVNTLRLNLKVFMQEYMYID